MFLLYSLTLLSLFLMMGTRLVKYLRQYNVLPTYLTYLRTTQRNPRKPKSL